MGKTRLGDAGWKEEPGAEERQVTKLDPHKKFTNGHKFFLAHESKGYVELLKREESTQTNYHATKMSKTRPRDPLNGDPTPRDKDGNAVLNTSKPGAQAVGGQPLFPERVNVLPFEQTATYQTFLKKQAVGKIGVDEERYSVLGNTVSPLSALPDDLAYLVKKTGAPKKSSKEAMQREVTENIQRQKLMREQRKLNREFINMKLDLEAKESNMNTLSSTFRLN
jgi:hypothetical protein